LERGFETAKISRSFETGIGLGAKGIEKDEIRPHTTENDWKGMNGKKWVNGEWWVVSCEKWVASSEYELLFDEISQSLQESVDEHDWSAPSKWHLPEMGSFEMTDNWDGLLGNDDT